jgi:hypothetical protein
MLWLYRNVSHDGARGWSVETAQHAMAPVEECEPGELIYKEYNKQETADTECRHPHIGAVRFEKVSQTVLRMYNTPVGTHTFKRANDRKEDRPNDGYDEEVYDDAILVYFAKRQDGKWECSKRGETLQHIK